MGNETFYWDGPKEYPCQAWMINKHFQHSVTSKKYFPAIETWQITDLDIAPITPRKCSFDSHDERRNPSRNDNLFSTHNEKCVRHCSGRNDI